MRSLRPFVLSASCLLTIGPCSLLAQDTPAGKTVAPPVQKPRVLVTISKETTYITEPLRKDGYPDYIAALNERCSKGVTPDNNAAVPFWKAMGPAEIPKKDRKQFFQMLGIPPLPEKGDYFIDLDEFAARQKHDNGSQTAKLDDEESRKLWDAQRSASERPWSRKEFPVLAGWLDANEKPLALVAAAVERPRFYQPLISTKTGSLLDMEFLSRFSRVRAVVRALQIRITHRISEGKLNEAWHDALTCHRLGRLVAQGPTLVEELVGITIEGIACQGDRILLSDYTLPSTKIAAMWQDLRRLPAMPKMVDKIDVTERFYCLDTISTVARNGLGEISKLAGGGVVPNSALDFVVPEAVDWDVVLRMANSWCDRIVAAFREPTRAERTGALSKRDADVKTLAESSKNVTSFALSFLANPQKAISDRIGQVFVVLFFPSVSACANVDDRATMQFELTKLAFALRAV